MGSGSSLAYYDLSHIGLRRSNNQDARGIVVPWSRDQYRRRGWLFVVADGMGAHAAGEEASALAVQEVTATYEKLAGRSPPLALRTSIVDANAKIHARGETSPDLQGMGTTCTALALLPRGALVGHVGDSRAYRVRRGTIEQLSQDHSLAWELEAQPDRAEHVIPSMVRKNIITRSMGPHPEVLVDLEGPFPVESDDVYVLCSDGLSGQVADQEIGAVAAALPPKEAAESLIGLALARGAPDNVTVIVARTGDAEKSRLKPQDEPWRLDATASLDERQSRLAWWALLMAGLSLLVSLICFGLARNPAGDVGRGFLEGWQGTTALVASALFALLFIASLLFAVYTFLLPTGGQALPPGGTIGRGPYRSYDCRATPQLVEGIAASVDSAADGLEEAQRGDCTAPLARARSAAASGDFTTSFAALAEALAAFTRLVATAA